MVREETTIHKANIILVLIDLFLHHKLLVPYLGIPGAFVKALIAPFGVFRMAKLQQSCPGSSMLGMEIIAIGFNWLVQKESRAFIRRECKFLKSSSDF
jgi:hypothetical protein